MQSKNSASRFMSDMFDRQETSDYSFVYAYLFAGIVLVVSVLFFLPRIASQ
jgi:hypothetical protein